MLIYVPKAYLELEIYVCQILLFSLSCKIMLIYVPKAYLELEVYAWRCPLDLMIFFFDTGKIAAFHPPPTNDVCTTDK